jgi:hypothetical protein
MMHQMNQRSGEHALILDALRNAYAEFHDPNGIALSRNRVLRSRPDRGSTPITRNKVCIKPSFTVNRFVGSPTPPRPGPGGLPPAATRSGVSCTTYSTQKLDSPRCLGGHECKADGNRSQPHPLSVHTLADGDVLE